MLFHSITILACALSVVTRAAASPTRPDVSVVVDNILNNATVNALDRRDDLIVRVDVDTGDVLDNVDFLSKKRDDVVSVDLYVTDLLNNVTVGVLNQ
ncbi:hypothetical protein EV702DRAFT_1192813 [Suillus placidus]|uniref:Uncharacterized protein n=1 Tax=Suillus placidus TaxID=48579 RepID=A0A9P7A5K5_9AGAM|nr:hypothetical protein EV702DRAFT_1192813 [Suillus placidus]